MSLNTHLWGFKKLESKAWPVVGAGTNGLKSVKFNLKDTLPDETLARLFLRVVGSIVVSAGAAGVATGQDNPESLVVQITAQTNPAVAMISKNQLTPRGIIRLGIFDRGYSVRGAAIADAAATVPVDFTLPLLYKQPGSRNPIEWALPMKLFSAYPFTVNLGTRDQLFTGGATTWDCTGLTLEVWAEYDQGIAGKFHMTEQFEVTVPVTQTQPDLTFRLDPGFYYTHLLFMAEEANVLTDAIIQNITVQGGGRIWTPQGDNNYLMIQRWNRESHLYNSTESLVGIAFVPALRDGMFTRSIEALTEQVQIKFAVTKGAGVDLIRIHGRRIKPQALQVAQAA